MTLTHDRQSTRIAPRLAGLLEPLFDGDLPVRIRAWDGSDAGPARAAAVIRVAAGRSAGCCGRPGELGLARAYVTGDIDVEGDLPTASAGPGRWRPLVRRPGRALAPGARPGRGPAHGRGSAPSGRPPSRPRPRRG